MLGRKTKGRPALPSGRTWLTSASVLSSAPSATSCLSLQLSTRQMPGQDGHRAACSGWSPISPDGASRSGCSALSVRRLGLNKRRLVPLLRSQVGTFPPPKCEAPVWRGVWSGGTDLFLERTPPEGALCGRHKQRLVLLFHSCARCQQRHPAARRAPGSRTPRLLVI